MGILNLAFRETINIAIYSIRIAALCKKNYMVTMRKFEVISDKINVDRICI
jgi:hypothetical protein